LFFYSPHILFEKILKIQFFSKRHNVKVYVQHEVTEILPNKKAVVVKDLKRGMEKKYKYDKLILVSGATAKRLPVPGIILKTILRPDVKNAVIVGAGFIGLEMAESFSKQGLKVTIIEREKQVLKKNRISVLTGTMVKEFKGNSD